LYTGIAAAAPGLLASQHRDSGDRAKASPENVAKHQIVSFQKKAMCCKEALGSDRQK
jgi:hypothetical protein